jgi:hypothetical protein
VRRGKDSSTSLAPEPSWLVGNFTIERSADGIEFTQIDVVGAGVTAYSDIGLVAAKTYYYQVRAHNSVGSSDYSNTAHAATQAAPTLPAAPSNLSATAVSRSQINLTRTDQAGNATGFKIERSTNGRSFSHITIVGANVTSYSNTGLSRSTTYTYRVRAYNTVANSAYSGIARATTPRN